jgi:hypothetical protein
MSQQLGLLDAVQRDEKPRKQVRKVSRQQYAELRDSDRLSAGQHAVLTAIAAIYNSRQDWPTRAEIATWMFEHGRLPRNDVSLIAPRLTELSRGLMNRKTRVYEGGGVIEALPGRPCRIAQTAAHPWRIVEVGARFRIGP